MSVTLDSVLDGAVRSVSHLTKTVIRFPVVVLMPLLVAIVDEAALAAAVAPVPMRVAI